MGFITDKDLSLDSYQSIESNDRPGLKAQLLCHHLQFFRHMIRKAKGSTKDKYLHIMASLPLLQISKENHAEEEEKTEVEIAFLKKHESQNNRKYQWEVGQVEKFPILKK